MKRFFSLALILVCLFSLASCKKEKNEPATTTTETTTTESLTVTVTFPEGFTVAEIAARLEESDVCNALEFVTLSNNLTFLRTLGYSFIDGIDEPEKRPFVLEGYIFPDTYEFYRQEGAEAALKRFLDNTQIKLKAEYYEKAKEMGYTIDDILTLASIIQEEASEHKYMADVSSVLHNRLNDPYGKLECDVAIHYIRNTVEPSPYITYDSETVWESYDIYDHAGLPVGPICNPGTHAIEAALSPSDTDYYFFVTDKDWNYYFNETWEAHDAKCRELDIY